MHLKHLPLTKVLNEKIIIIIKICVRSINVRKTVQQSFSFIALTDLALFTLESQSKWCSGYRGWTMPKVFN